MNKGVRKTIRDAMTIAAGVAALWYLVHQVWRALYFATKRNEDRDYDTEAYLGIID